MKVIVVDRHQLFCDGLCRVLENMPKIELESACGTFPNIIEWVIQRKADILFVDPSIFESTDAISRIKQAIPRVRIIILTHSEVGSDLVSAFSQGAIGYISKDITRESLTKVVDLIIEGNIVIDQAMARLVFDIFKFIQDHAKFFLKPEQIYSVTDQEKQILTLLLKGATNREIAKTLCVTENTVKVHIRNLMRKLDVHSRLEAGMCALREGLLHDTYETKGKKSTHDST
jgi:two-component system nitrate/nitrite response regulator NarL